MTDQSSPITPPPELVQQWFKQAHESADPANQLSYYDFIATAAAQWGADQELEACCEWLKDPCAADMPSLAKDLRYSRRPKPPSLKEQALERLMNLEQGTNPPGFNDYDTIRRALKALPNG
jgi:hypothetical protein